MNDDQFDKLFKYIQTEFAKVDRRFDETNNRIDRVYILVDEDLKRRETDEQERLALTHQVDLHEAWIERASAELKIKYDRTASA